ERKKVCECPTGPNRKNPNSRRCGSCERPVKPLADATINLELVILQHMFSQRREWGLSTVNPMEGVEVFKIDNARTRYLTPAEAERLLAASEPHFRPIVLTALHCGFRKSELKTLQWQNVNLQDRSIIIVGCYSKNKKPRTVLMTQEVFETLKR